MSCFCFLFCIIVLLIADLYYLGMCHNADGEPVEARRLLSEARMILEKTQGYDDEETKMGTCASAVDFRPVYKLKLSVSVVGSLLTLRRNATEIHMGGEEEPRRRCTIL